MVDMDIATSTSESRLELRQRGLVLHAAWVGARGGKSQTLALWAEAQQRPVRQRRPNTVALDSGNASESRSLTASARPIELLDALDRLWRTARPGVRPRSSCSRARLEIELPGIGARATPSPEALERGWAREQPGDTPSTLMRWRTHALLLTPTDAIALLPGLPIAAGSIAVAQNPRTPGTPASTRFNHDARSDTPAPEMALGADLRFWAAAARFALSMVARQRYLPGAREKLPSPDDYYSYYGRGPSVVAEWSLALLDQADREQFAALAAAMPDSARAAYTSPADMRNTGSIASRESLLDDFCSTMINTLLGDWIRRAGVSMELPRVASPHSARYGFGDYFYSGYGSLTSRWLRALAMPGYPISLNPSEVRGLLDGVERWHARAQAERNVPFRLCLRLSAPQPPESEGDAPLTPEDTADPTSASQVGAQQPRLTALDDAPTDDTASDAVGAAEAEPASARPHLLSSFDEDAAGWRLDYLLQARDDPSLQVSIAEVWREPGDAAEFLERQFDRPYEHALGWLGQAARLFPPMQPHLREGEMDGCDLTGAEAYTFLRDAVSALEEVGIGVQAPAWWKRAPIRPTLRLEVRRAPQISSGLLGLESVISFDWKVALGGEELSPEDLEQLVSLKQPLVRLRGQWVELRREDVDAVMRTLERRSKRGMSLGEALRVSMTGQTDDAELEVEELRADAWLADLLARVRGADALTEAAPPVGLRTELRPYQQRGLDWLSFLTRYGLGACLADDMGLGKTVQLLALALRLKEQGALTHPILLVCPTSVVGNWAQETRRFAPDLRVMIHHGAGRVGRADSARFAAEAAEHDLVVTTYSLLPRDEKALAMVPWSVIALDEAQYIKNAETKQARAARALDAPMRVALTGTPVENRLAELWSIMRFLNPGYLGSQASFHERFATPIEQRHDARASAQLQALVRPFVLRRLKTDQSVIRDLPEKVEMREYCTLTREQATLYEAVVREGLRQLEQSDDPMARRGAVLAMLSRLKQVCNHPAHFLNDGSALAGRSGKLARLDDLVAELLDEGDRALIFTQFTVMGDRLREYLDERFKIKTLYLHGATPRAQRERMVEQFQSEDGPPLFLLSLRAGGTGLNLTHANHVIHFDRWWNPAVETQATDRAFRIGQTRNVQVRKFVCSGTLEERIDEMIEQKRALAEGVFGAGEGWLTELSTAELRDLFRLRADAVAD